MALPRNCLMGRVPITRPTRDLRAIIAKAKVHGLSCWPWVGVTKGTPQRWADICSEMAHASGLAFIDVEAPADFHAFMAEYRVKTPENFPVLCTCGGNPVTWSTGWPGPTAVQEGVVFSPQFYFPAGRQDIAQEFRPTNASTRPMRNGSGSLVQ